MTVPSFFINSAILSAESSPTSVKGFWPKAPITVLAVKDRVFDHCPILGVYLSQGPYYGRLRFEEPYEAAEKAEKP